jgi:pyocin large subunit-like protein
MKSIGALFRSSVAGRNNHMGHNFRSYGAALGAYDFEDFVEMARQFYDEAMRSRNAAFTTVRLPRGRLAIDRDGELRGVYDRHGNPLAFFRPNFRHFGYNNKEEELENFRAGRNLLFS